jgi:ABC-type branched-subunit amino acid transport system substrate-binding protein
MRTTNWAGKRRQLRAVGLVLTAALAVAACGDDSGKSAATTVASSTNTTTGAGAATPTTAAPVALGPGVSDTEVKFGVIYYDATGLTAAQVATIPDEKKMAQILSDEVNAAGGINGRKLTPVPVGFKIATPDPGPVKEQAICASLTQDNKVFAGFLIQNTSDVSQGCLEKAGAVGIGWPITGAASDETFAKYPHYVAGGALSVSHFGELVSAFVASGQLPKDAKLGIETVDSSLYKDAINKSVLPALTKAGINVVQTVYVPDPSSIPGQDAAVTVNNSAALKMKASGADYVWMIGDALLFMNAAGKQGYQPHYLMTTAELPSTIASPPPGFDGASVAARSKTTGLGYSAQYDLTGADVKLTPTGDACVAKFTAAGMNITGQSPIAVATAICDQFSILVAGIKGAGADLNNDTFMTALESAGPIPSANFDKLQYTKDARDGVSAVRPFAFSADCSCFRYSGDSVDLTTG